MSTIHNLPMKVAWTVMNLLMERRAMIRQEGIVFYAWPRADRIIVAFDPSAIDTAKVNEDFAHRLSTRLGGRRVIRTNSRGIFLQVGFEIPPVPLALEAMPLDLAKQPGAWHIPIGMTELGPLWIDLTEADSILIGGSRGGGKTGELHGWIQALLHGGKTLIYASDGKRGLEFSAYAANKNFHFYLDQVRMLEEIVELLRVREKQLQQSGHPNILLHNDAGGEFIAPIALFIDEAADLPDLAKDQLKSMIRLYRHLGLYPIVATNQPTVADVFSKTNLSTRIAFRVPHHNDSVTMLGYKGAEALPDIRGRGLVVWKGSFVEFQSFIVTYATPTAETRQLLHGMLDADPGGAAATAEKQEIDRVKEMIAAGHTTGQIIREMWRVYGGARYQQLKAKVEEIRRTSSSSGPTPAGEETPQKGRGEGEEARATEGEEVTI